MSTYLQTTEDSKTNWINFHSIMTPPCTIIKSKQKISVRSSYLLQHPPPPDNFHQPHLALVPCRLTSPLWPHHSPSESHLKWINESMNQSASQLLSQVIKSYVKWSTQQSHHQVINHSIFNVNPKIFKSASFWIYEHCRKLHPLWHRLFWCYSEST